MIEIGFGDFMDDEELEETGGSARGGDEEYEDMSVAHSNSHFEYILVILNNFNDLMC